VALFLCRRREKREKREKSEGCLSYDPRIQELSS
jgi:hypothetical protein